jgi:pimeloyl-ACP methyl ester carboxylesterase
MSTTSLLPDVGIELRERYAGGFRSRPWRRRVFGWSHRTRAATTSDLLADDIRGLIGELGAESAMLVGHDWGGTIAWTTAMNHPEVVDRLAILNAAHPRRLSEGLKNPNQLRSPGTSSSLRYRDCRRT